MTLPERPKVHFRPYPPSDVGMKKPSETHKVVKHKIQLTEDTSLGEILNMLEPGTNPFDYVFENHGDSYCDSCNGCNFYLVLYVEQNKPDIQIKREMKQWEKTKAQYDVNLAKYNKDLEEYEKSVEANKKWEEDTALARAEEIVREAQKVYEELKAKSKK